MRNLISYFALATVLFFASCTKEALIIPGTDTNLTIEERSTSVQLPVTEVNSSQTSGLLTVNFEGEYDFSEAVVENTQYLKFTDANDNETILTFQISSYSGGNGSLNTVFSLGTNNLSGLDLMGVQEIIIEDVALN